MSTPELPLASPVLTRRGRLQRLVRHHRETAVRDAGIAAVLCLAVLLTLHTGPTLLGSPAEAADDDAATAEAVDRPWGDDPATTRFTATMVGDLMFGRHVQRAAERVGYDGLLAPTAPWLEGDYVSGNLEQVISDRIDELPEADKLIHLASGPGALQAMVDAGFTTVSLANNHLMDHGVPGLRDTIAALDEVGLAHAGAGEDLDAAVRPDVQEHGGLTVVTLSFTDAFVQGFIALPFQGGVLSANPESMVPRIQQAAQAADLVIVNLHWGAEYDFGPNARQRELAEYAAAAGADIVVGHHPHVLQPVERLEGTDTLVFWSLGNFVFDQGWTRTRESVIARYALGDDGVARIELLPVWIREGTPRPLSGPLSEYRRARMHHRLQGDGLTWDRDGDRLVTTIDHRHVLGGQDDA